MSATILIITTVQKLLEEFGQEWAGSDDICDWLGICNRDLELELQGLDLNFNTQVEIIPGVPANTTDLSAYQTEGGPLFGMILPKVIEWRLAGQNQEQWQDVPNVQKVIDTDTGTGEDNAPVVSATDIVESYEWRGGLVYISPCSQIVDYRVRFQGLPTQLNADSPNQPILGLVNPLAYLVTMSLLDSRGGPTTPYSQKIMARYTRTIATFRSTQVKAQQSIVVRLGGRRSRQPGTVGPFSAPLGE